MITLSVEEFASRRKVEQAGLEDALRPAVKRWLTDEETHLGALVDVIRAAYAEVYEAAGGTKQPTSGHFVRQVKAALRKGGDPDAHTVDRITVWLATGILNAATISAAKHDPEEIELRWVSMHDDKVREAHKDADGQTQPPSGFYMVAGHRMRYPGDPSAPIELWINCRCTLAPVKAESVAASAGFAAPSETEFALDKHKLSVIVALPADGEAVHNFGEEQKHITLAFLGDWDFGDGETLQRLAAQTAANVGPFTARVSGAGHLGPDKAKVLFVEADEIEALREHLLNGPELLPALEEFDHPHFVPHMTLTYDDDAPEVEVDEIKVDRLAVWHGDQQTEYALGGAMPDEPEVTDEVPTEEPEEETFAADLIPWHGVLTVEGKKSGDNRRFSPSSLSARPFPLPLTWQKVSDDGHKNSVTVARIDRAWRMPDGQIRGDGVMLATPEADEFTGLMADFGRYGVSVDVDDAEMAFDDETEMLDFTKARIAGAAGVAIPAFHEAFVALGEWDEEDQPDEDADFLSLAVENDEALVASVGDRLAKLFKRGPGWITDPVATKRLHDYWTKPGEQGYNEIGWGKGGDFNRCRVLVGEKIAENSPEDTRYLNQICAQWHKDALGYWPAEHKASLDEQRAEGASEAPAVSLVASSVLAEEQIVMPAAWFQNPNFTERTPFTVTDEGQVYGHLAEWDTCHMNFADVCVVAPFSETDYAYFLTGEVLTDAGPVDTGRISLGGGHADIRKKWRAAVEHYDSTSAAVCDVTCGEDEFGIWIAGAVRPGTTPEQVYALRASPLSGDWRKVGLGMELIAALAVNSGGFPIPRSASVAGRQMSLVAAGMIEPEPVEPGFDPEVFADAVIAALDKREDRRRRLAALAQKVEV